MERNITIEINGQQYKVFLYQEEGADVYSAVVDNDQAFEFWEDDTDSWEFTPTNDREEDFRRQVVYEIINSPGFRD